MTTLLDAWRAVDPAARHVSGSLDDVSRPVRGVARTRAVPPHLPPVSPGQLLVVDAAVVAGVGLDEFVAAVREVADEPVGLWLVGDQLPPIDRAGDELPVLAGTGNAATRADEIARYLDTEPAVLAATGAALRLAGAEAALSDPQPAAPAGVVASRVRRGVAVSIEGALASLNPRPAGRALASRFAAVHARLLAERGGAPEAARRMRDGLWVMGRQIGPGATAWLFDDLPFARIDDVALEALATTLRALLRRPAQGPGRSRREPALPPSSGDPVRDTLLAVARANGRIAPAARALGVHRNTVLYRLRRASAELGIDPRRPDDALRLLRQADRRD